MCDILGPMGPVLSTGTRMDTIFQRHTLNSTFKCHESLTDCFREEASLNPTLCIFLKSNGSVCSRHTLAIGLNVKINSPMRTEAHSKICLSFILPSLSCQAVLPKGGTGNTAIHTISLCCFSWRRVTITLPSVMLYRLNAAPSLVYMTCSHV